MPAVASRPNPAHIMQELESLPFSSLDKLVPKIIALRLMKHPQVMSKREGWLQKRVEAGAPRAMTAAFAQLIEKRRTSGLAERERRRVEELVERMEAFNVKWLGWARELAEIRRTSVEQLLKSLSIARPAYV